MQFQVDFLEHSDLVPGYFRRRDQFGNGCDACGVLQVLLFKSRSLKVAIVWLPEQRLDQKRS